MEKMIRHALIARDNWDKAAIIENGQCISYRDIARKAAGVRQRLPQRKRENIAIFLPNGADYVAALFGTFMAGMTAFPLNPKLTVYEIVPLLAQVSAHTVITSKAHQALIADAVKAYPVQIVYVEELPEPPADALTARAYTDAGAPMLLLTTSGTTGNAKIVQLSEKNFETSVLGYIDKMDYGKFSQAEIRLILATPFCAIYGLMVLAACTIKSIPVAVLEEPFALKNLYRSVEQYKITHFEGGVSVALLMEQTAGRVISYDISTLRYFGMAGSKTSADTLRKLVDTYAGIEFHTGYGMTEAGPLIAKPYKKMNMDKPDSVGTASKCVTIKVAGADGALTDAPHIRGEIAVKGPNIMQGYYENEEATRKILKDGYLYTGDIGYLDEDGDLYICGRKKNVIIVRGFNVYAEEVEACLLNSGLVRDCIVYGEADVSGKEIVCADVVPMNGQTGTNAIRAYCEVRLAGYKQPRKIEIVEVVRKTATGKTKRAEADK